ncbi:alanine/glycine:cation symporter family protein [Maricaulis maris]|uniref:AGCS family alanine or glycine:cation symporter n=1 Tax=Maricaulis maris TaxID=74318 RepID=A0A495D2F4_9PROT|nr:alanine/glycine:cation symporter family protein [Maricaulis maris]RKQ95958.1 AGCS family alanine or glycine:cation symporter [Maricaulis maris]
MNVISGYVDMVNGFVWGPPMLLLLLGTGLYLTIGLGFMPLRKIGFAFGELLKGRKSEGDGDVTPFQALMTALSSTIGTGNIAGVAVAIAIGGPGALFWMWMTALVGMATKFSEGVLAVKFREVDADGRRVGGPMYYIKNGMGKKWVWLGGLFAFFGVMAGLGTGNAIQTAEVVRTVGDTYGVDYYITGGVIAVLAGMVILGGIKRIASVAEKVVPAMAITYIALGLVVVVMNIEAVPAAFASIFSHAFGFGAAAGGFSGALLMLAMQRGVARGIFSNEAGQGSAPIAHAAAQNNDPVDQGIIAMLGTFIDTIMVCSITGLAILTSGVIPTECDAGLIALGGNVPEICDTGARITTAAFADALPGFGDHFVTWALALFAFTTILGWSYYGERCAEYLLGEKVIIPFRLAWIGMILGATFLLYAGDNVTQLMNTVWLTTDTLTGLMAAPNLIALLVLSPLVFKMTKAYFDKLEKGAKTSDETPSA